MPVRPHRVGGVGNNTETRHISIGISVRPVTVTRGSQGTAYINVQGHGAEVRITVSSNYPEIVVTNIVPEYGKPPLTSYITVHVSAAAKPGTYYLEVTIIDIHKGEHLAFTTIPIFVVDSEEVVKVLKDLDKYRKTYERYGIQCSILKMLADYALRVTFSNFKTLYEAVVGHKVSNGTIDDLIKRLLKKRLIVKEGNRYRFNNEELDFETAKTLIDTKRSVNGMRGAVALRKSNDSDRSRSESNDLRIPKTVARALDKSKQLIAKGEYWKAVDFLAHTVIGIRKTGVWLLWVNNIFVYKENKTGFLHYFKSRKLPEVLKSIGVEEGFMYKHTDNPADDLILSIYGSHTNARRLHYLLKELNWVQYGEPLILEISDKSLALTKLDGEAIIELGNKEKSNLIKRYLVYGGEHIDEENEETYFYMPAGLY